MEVLQRNQLFCKPSKCVFGATEILYLGHFVSGNSIRPDPKKLAAVEEWPVPESITQVRSFLGFANYFRRFIPRFAEIAQPLDEVTGRHAQFSWNKKRQDAFDSLKSSLLCAPVLQLPNVTKPFRVHTDASDVAIAALLEQERDSAWHPVAYTSRKLTSAETNYTIAERETLAVVFALTSWKLYLFQHFDLFTGSQAVIYLQSKRHVTKREARWMETLADFHFTLHHVPGKADMADPLTRQDRVYAQMNSIEFSLDLELDDNEELSAGYGNDSELSDIIRRLTSTRQDTLHEQYLWNDLSQRLYLTTSDSARLCIPRGPLRLKLLQENHDCVMAGHPGRDRTYWNLSRHFYWPRMGRDVKAFVRSCESCQRNKSGKNQGWSSSTAPDSCSSVGSYQYGLHCRSTAN